MATTAGIAKQGMSAAIVLHAIDKISEMINRAESAMVSSIDSEIVAAVDFAATNPEVAKLSYRDPYYGVQSALKDANLNGEDPEFSKLPLFLDNVIGTFFEDYTGKLDAMFPGLGIAGADADAFVRAALNSAIGVSYNEQVDSTPVQTAFLEAQRRAFTGERDALDKDAATGHRFASGPTLELIARMHGGAAEAAGKAAVSVYARRLEQERTEKMRMIRACLDTDMDRVKKLHRQVAEAFKLKLQARGMWINDQNAVVDSFDSQWLMNERFHNNLLELMRRTALRRYNLRFDETALKDRTDFLGKLKIANANEVVDLFGNMVTTLMNQVSGRGSYQGSERDITDWDSLLA